MPSDFIIDTFLSFTPERLSANETVAVFGLVKLAPFATSNEIVGAVVSIT